MTPPLFIIGTSRSGTSWAFDLCASHPNMSMGYESKLPVEGIEIYRRHRGALTASRSGSDTTTSSETAAFQAFFAALRDQIDDPSSRAVTALLDDPAVIERAAQAHHQSPGWGSVCEAIFCSLEDTTHWGNKMLRVELLPTLREHWPDAVFIVLTRDPRGVMASQSKKFDHSADYSAMYWNTHADFILEHIGVAPSYLIPHTRVVDLVDMARDPRPTLEWAFGEMGLSLEPINDLIDRYPGDPDRLDKWRTSLERKLQLQIEEFCFDNMSRLGYSPELATTQRDLSKARRVIAMAREHGGELIRDPGSIRRKRIPQRVMSALRPGHRS